MLIKTLKEKNILKIDIENNKHMQIEARAADE